MKILIANDDGIQAAGLRALVEVLAPHHELFVVAPNKERSAMGHALTLHRPLRLDKLPQGYFRGVDHAYTIDGTPTDCIKIALTRILDFTPDLVVSGINHGPNMGSDIIYSGTVSIAMEGAIYGIKSIAFSLDDLKQEGFEEDAQVIPEIIEMLLAEDFPWFGRTLYNVNLPSLSKVKKPKGIYYTRLGSRMYTDDYDQRIDPRNRYYYWLSGELVSHDPDAESDITKCRDGYITITPISLDFENLQIMNTLLKRNSH